MITTNIYLKLPMLKNNQSWCCSKGCGDCNTVDAIHERMIETDNNGKVIHAVYEHYHVSSCCKADLLLWDDDIEGFVDYEEIDPRKLC